jgi:hypothetical protein
MIRMLAQTIHAMPQMDVPTPQLLVMITTHVPKIVVTPLAVVFTLVLLAMIMMLAQLIVAI